MVAEDLKVFDVVFKRKTFPRVDRANILSSTISASRFV